jgi:rhodanese-related sulfurtransferase
MIPAAILLAAAACEPPAERRDISADEAVRMIEERRADPDFVILDVRTPEEFRQERLPDAENLDFRARDFETRLETLNRDKAYLVYCASGRRSSAAADRMAEKRFREVYNVLGGLQAIKATPGGGTLVVKGDTGAP